MAVTFLFEDEERLDWASDGITSYLYYVFWMHRQFSVGIVRLNVRRVFLS